MNIYTPYLPNVKYSTPDKRTLHDVLNIIRSNKHAAHVQEILNEPDDAKRKILKSELLSAFFPTVQFFNTNNLDETSTPTGIIQFDIDAKDNIGMNFSDIKQLVAKTPEVLYAFISPSGGVKFGLRTDFHKHDDECIDSTKERYKQAYENSKKYFSRFIELKFDDSVGYLKTACYLSCDENAQYNPNCETYLVDDRTSYTPPVFSTESNIPVSNEQVEELLSYIPHDYSYDERFKINRSVFGHIGSSGIQILFNHWSKPEREELLEQLKEQANPKTKSGKKLFGNIGHLINVAKEHGYQPTPPVSRRKLTAKPIDYKFPPLLSVEEASAQLQKYIQSFFDEKKSMLINVSTGFGKTQTALEILRSIPPTIKVLYLVNNHKLANEIKEKFYDIKLDVSTFSNKVKRKSSINHIKGKGFIDEGNMPMCEMPDKLKAYEDAGINMPLAECITNCMHFGECRYTNQFSKIDNIRLMTHNEFVNESSAWFHGSKIGKDGVLIPKVAGWKPDYIIVDEDWMTRKDSVEKISSEYSSIRNIINDCMNGSTLAKSISNHETQVIKNYYQMKGNKPSAVKFINRKQYIEGMTKNKNTYWSNVLKIFNCYISSGYDEDYLHGTRYDPNREMIIKSHMVEISSRYKNIPTMYLDATADEVVVKSAIHDIEFHSIKVKCNDEINVYQCENYTWSKKRLGTDKGQQNIIHELIPYAKKYKSVGLITYLNLPDKPDFDAWLAAKLGITIYSHFGNLRGLDEFKDVDCILIVGRHMIPQYDLIDYSHAIFSDVENFNNEYVDTPVRMKDGASMALSNHMYTDSRVEHIKKHFSTAETIQAIGRGRLIHGTPKDIYLFSNESLGSEVEITGFFRYEEQKYLNAVNQLKRIGYCKNKPKELQALGISVNSSNRDRVRIDEEFIAAGILKETLKIEDKDRNTREHEYYISDMNALKQYLHSQESNISHK